MLDAGSTNLGRRVVGPAILPERPTLRDYQDDAIAAATRYVLTGGKRGLIVQPTGAGKSVLVGALAHAFAERGVLIVSHVAELIQQDAAACERFLAAPMVGIYSAGLRRRELNRPVTVASIQSIVRRLDKLRRPGLLLADEAHLIGHDEGSQYRKLLSHFGDVPLVGLTATAWRTSTGRLTDPWRDQAPLFDTIVHQTGIAELIEAGWLCRPRCVAPQAAIDAAGVHVRQGEFVAGELEARCNEPGLNAAIAREIVSHGAERRSWLVFAAGIAHAEALAEALWDLGITAAVVTGGTPPADRFAIVSAYKRGDVRALVSVNCLSVGFDAPQTDLIALCRPTMSPGLHVQQIGRGTRLAEGKRDALVLDFAGNVARHGPLDLIDGTRRPGEVQTKTCPSCRTIVDAGAKECSDCGHEFAAGERQPRGAPVLHSRPIGAAMLSDEAEPPRTIIVRWMKARTFIAKDEAHLLLTFGGEAGPPVTHPVWFNSFSRQRLVDEWERFGGRSPAPRTAEEALSRFNRGELHQPDLVVGRAVSRGGRMFWNLVHLEMDDPPLRLKKEFPA